VLRPSRHTGTPLTITLSMPRAARVRASKLAAHADVAGEARPVRAVDDEDVADKEVIALVRG
jgi:hypothetical protein